MSIDYPCSIKGCGTFTKLDHALKNDEFALCTSDENAVFVNLIQKMADGGWFPKETPYEMAQVLNAFRRGRKGVALGTRPASVGN